MANHYDVPAWAGKPPVGLHLDVMKGDKLIQKLMVDEKKCYLFGRNPQLNDFCIDHASCSRVHAAMVWHKHLNRAFMVDLGSTHGTHIGSVQLEGHKPTQLPLDSRFHFGASTRIYILRERPQVAPKSLSEEKERNTDELEGGLLGLPETETELDNLTEFNTAHNRRITMLGIVEEDIRPQPAKKRRRNSVTFNEEEEIINPEDIDPSVGRFRNLVQTTVIQTKQKKQSEGAGMLSLSDSHNEREYNVDRLYADLPDAGGGYHGQASTLMFSAVLTGKLGLPLPNPAPDVDLRPPTIEVHPIAINPDTEPASYEPKKKKYAKEAWPGKKPVPALLV